MKKNFFKKLSFVLALAMILSTIAPIASAFAAAGPKLNATKKYLHLDVAKQNEYNFNIANKKSGWKYVWESSNEAVAEVNKSNGVAVATGVGTARITCTITDKKGEEVAVLKATVVVRDNIKELTITNKPEGDKLAVGAENDFNRSFVTNSGNSKKTSGITRWTVEPAEGATIADNGVFVATKAGKYTINAYSFQSLEKYNTWKADAAANAGLVTATTKYEVTVAASVADVKQKNLDTATVLFDSEVEGVDKNIAVYRVVGNDKVLEFVKKITVAADKKSAEIQMHANFTAGTEYVVEVKDIGSKSFVGAKSEAKAVDRIEVVGGNAVVTKPTDVKIKLYNADGVDITTETLITANVAIDAEGVIGFYLDKQAKKITIFDKDLVVKVKATFRTYEYDLTTGKEIGTREAEGVFVGVAEGTTSVGTIATWTLNGDLNKVDQNIVIGENGRQLHVRLNGTGVDGKAIAINSDETGVLDKPAYGKSFVYESTDTNVLIVGSTGLVYPVKEGSAAIIVKYGDAGKEVYVGGIAVVVQPKASVNTIGLSATNATVSNSNEGTFVDSVSIKVEPKDALGRPYSGFKYDLKLISAQTGILPITEGTDLTSGTIAVTGVVSGTSVPAGNYVYKITLGGREQIISVVVQNAKESDGINNRKATSYDLVLGATSVDLASTSDNPTRKVSVALIGYNAGVKVSKEVFGTEFLLEIKNPKGTVVTLDGDSNLVLSSLDAGGVVQKGELGTYTLTVKRVIENKEVAILQKAITVNDTQKLPTIKSTNQKLAAPVEIGDKTLQALRDAAQTAIIFNENKANENDVVRILEVNAVGISSEFNIVSIKYEQKIKEGVYVVGTMNIGLTVRIQ